MGLKATTVRMSEDLWELLEQEATRQGLSAAHVVRDCVLLRLGHLAAQRGDPAATTTIADLAGRSLDERRSFERDDQAQALADPRRLAALKRTGLVDAPRDPGLETLARLCADLLGIPAALVSLVAADRQFVGASCGLPQPWDRERNVRLSHSFCQHVVVSRKPLVVSDARTHPLLEDNLAIRDMGVIAYAGVPLVGADGEVLGTIAGIDRRPRAWNTSDLATLTRFAGSVMAHIQRTAAA